MARKKLVILWISTGLVCVLAGMMIQSVPQRWAERLAVTIAIVSITLWIPLTGRRKNRGTRMFERYTEKARRAIFFARYEANQFGAQYIDSDCLLLGLVRENKQIGRRWLGADSSELRSLVASHLKRSMPVSTSVDPPLTNEAKRVLAYAAEEADLLSHRHIGTEHLFLGLLREPGTLAAERIKERGVTIEQIRAATVQEPPIAEVGPYSVSLRGLKVRVLNESGEELAAFQWIARPPAIGEAVSIADEKGTEVLYRILDLTWHVQTGEDSMSQVREIVVKVHPEPT
jgi:Clp amino terminal domain, pathogenicity island component